MKKFEERLNQVHHTWLSRRCELLQSDPKILLSGKSPEVALQIIKKFFTKRDIRKKVFKRALEYGEVDLSDYGGCRIKAEHDLAAKL